MRAFALCLLLPFALSSQTIRTVPTFTGSFEANGREYSYTLAGRNPAKGGTTIIETVLVPLALSIQDSAPDLSAVIHSPIFEPFPFANGTAQYGDAVQRAQFATAATWHTVLDRPTILPPLKIDVPPANGYLLHSQQTGKSLAVVDLDFIQKQLLASAPASSDKLLIAVTRNVAFYSLGDATVCCSVGTHGVQPNASGTAARAFVIGSFFDPGVYPRYTDIQALSQQLAEFLNDPLYGYHPNEFPAWLEPPSNLNCGGKGESSSYLLEQPTDQLPASNSTKVTAHGRVYHLENMALLSWFADKAGAYSFPDTKALPAPARACSDGQNRGAEPTALPLPSTTPASRHKLIGYWEGYSSVEHPTPLRDVSPQWDIVIATFAAPVKGSTSRLEFHPPAALDDARFKADVAYLQSQGKKVLISLGGGGEVVTLNTPADLRDFVDSVSAIVEKYGFDGIDLDIETPSLLIQPGDTDFRNPTTPSIVNLIAAVHQIQQHFGTKFMLAEVPEAAQAQAGMQAYGGQFGCFLPVIYGTRDILSFVDAQDYNTPPLEGLDGNYYFPGTADYHTAMSEMLLAGFPVGGDRAAFFPPLPPEKVAIGLPATPASARNYTEIPAIEDALKYLVAGQPYPDARYRLRHPAGYPTFLGAMFWAINEDRRNEYRMSNAIGPFLHSLPSR